MWQRRSIAMWLMLFAEAGIGTRILQKRYLTDHPKGGRLAYHGRPAQGGARRMYSRAGLLFRRQNEVISGGENETDRPSRHVLGTGGARAGAACASTRAPVDPGTASTKNPNPATSTTTDEEGNNPLAREGDRSPTGQNPSMNSPSVYKPIEDITVGLGSRGPVRHPSRSDDAQDRQIQDMGESGLPSRSKGGAPKPKSRALRLTPPPASPRRPCTAPPC